MPYRRLNSGVHKCHSPVLALFRVLCWDFAVTMITVRAIARRPATTFGAGALIQDGGESSREAQRANRRLNSRLFRRRLVGTLTMLPLRGCLLESPRSLRGSAHTLVTPQLRLK
jgi:hypothetical protein